jgi:bacillithiol biosynthesis deacetylase BshB1
VNAVPIPDVFTADVLAIAAHRDDVEQTCGGTMLRMASRGLRTAILDLTQGEAGTRGSAEERAREADQAAHLLGVSWRQALELPDGAIENTLENRLKIVRVLRMLRPRVVILPYWQARHPDHAAVATLGYEACFLSGLAKAPVIASAPNAPQAPLAAPQVPHRPFKIVYASLYADVRPSFIVDITPFIEQRQQALMARNTRTSPLAADSLFPKRRFVSASLQRRAITDNWPACATASLSCRRKWAWWTILRWCLCNRFEEQGRLIRRKTDFKAKDKLLD